MTVHMVIEGFPLTAMNSSYNTCSYVTITNAFTHRYGC